MTVMEKIEEIVATVTGAHFKMNFGDAHVGNFTVSGPSGEDTYAVSKYGLLHVQLGGRDSVVAKAIGKIKKAAPWKDE